MLRTARFLTGGRRLRVYDAGPYHRPAVASASAPDAATAPDAAAGSTSVSAPVAARSPLIVLEGGLGAAGRSWASVFHRLAPSARVIAYDRAGYGGSDVDEDNPRSLVNLRDDLLAVIADAERDDTGPIVLVGHSWGAVIARSAAAVRLRAGVPVDGLVLVDPSDEEAEFYYSDGARVIDTLQRRVLVLAARVGLLRPIVAGQLAKLPRSLRRGTAADTGTVNAARAMSGETSLFVDGLRSVRESPPIVGDVPVRILSGVRADYGIGSIREQLRASHRNAAKSYADGQFIDATASAHGIPFTDPQLIADTAMELARAAS